MSPTDRTLALRCLASDELQCAIDTLDGITTAARRRINARIQADNGNYTPATRAAVARVVRAAVAR